MRRERFGRKEEFGRGVVSSQSRREVLPGAESRKRRSGWRTPDPPPPIENSERWTLDAHSGHSAWADEAKSAYLHRFYRVVGLLNAVDRQPLCILLRAVETRRRCKPCEIAAWACRRWPGVGFAWFVTFRIGDKSLHTISHRFQALATSSGRGVCVAWRKTLSVPTCHACRGRERTVERA